MIIKGTEVTRRDVNIEVDAGDLLEALRSKIYPTLGIPLDGYLTTKGHIVWDDDCGHGSPITRVVTETPDDNQIATIQAFRQLYKMLIRD